MWGICCSPNVRVDAMNAPFIPSRSNAPASFRTVDRPLECGTSDTVTVAVGNCSEIRRGESMNV